MPVKARNRYSPRVRTRALPVVAAAALTALLACGERRVELPLEVQSGDLVIVVSTIDGRATPSRIVVRPGEPIRVASDPERPIFTWVLRADAQVGPDGAPLDPALIEGAVARFVEDPRGEGGACERCQAPTLGAPQVVHPGDVCPLPDFAGGAVWRAEDGKYACRGGPGGRLCPEGAAQDVADLEQVRRRLRIDRPGACACTPSPPPASLEGLEITPIAPDNGFPLYAFAEAPGDRIAGFGRDGRLLVADTGGLAEANVDFPVDVQAAVGLRSGGFLVTGDLFNTGARDAPGYFRFGVEGGRLTDPVEVRPSAPVLARRMRYLGGPDQDFPLYLAGGIRDALGVDPALFACTDDRLACQQVSLTTCAIRPDFTRLEDVLITDGGFGLAVGNNALYYKTPTAGGPEPNDDWRCDQPLGPFEAPGEEGAITLSRFRSIGRVGSRLFVCGQEEVPACTPSRAVVLTATAGATDPSWRIAHVGPRNSSCSSFIEGAAKVTFVRSGTRLVDLDAATGEVTDETTVFERYGPLDGFYELYPMPSGAVVVRASENRVFVATASTAFRPVYGEAERRARTFHAALPKPGGGFYAFGDPPAPVEVRATGEVGPHPGDFSALDGARIFAATRAGEGTTDGLPVLLGGERDGRPLLVRGRLTAAGLEGAAEIPLPEGAVSVRHLAHLGDRAVAGTLGTRLFSVQGEVAEPIELAWDDPLTEALESRPTDPIDGCSGEPRRLDLWRALFGSNGVGWAIGARGVAFQLTPAGGGATRAERFAVPASTQLTAGLAQCAARTWLGGQGRVVDASGIEDTSLQLFSLSAVDEPRRGETPGDALDPRRAALAPLAEVEIDTVQVLDIVYGVPIAVLADLDARGDVTPTVVLDNGFLYRARAGARLEYLRVPFRPSFAVQGETGAVLFGGGDARLALGRPR